MLARAADHWWDELAQPDPFVIIEAGAATGTLARAVLDAQPRCAPALRYVLVERSAALRRRQAASLPLELPAFALGPAAVAADDDDGDPGAVLRGGTGPFATSLAELPSQPFPGVVVANELLDNLAFLLLERAEGGWSEVRVGESAGKLAEVIVPAAPDLAAAAARVAPDAPVGGRVPIQLAAQGWLRKALGAVSAGRVVVLDYGDHTDALAGRPWTDWIRTYRGHGRGGHPLHEPGSQDVTCEVAFDQLTQVRQPAAVSVQAAFLRAHGIDELVEEAEAAWRAGAATGDLASMRARSRVQEAAALTDPDGLGGFTVVEWAVP